MSLLARIPWRFWRRAAQAAALVLFLVLFRWTAYRGSDDLTGWENLFFRLDPLAGVSAMLAARRLLAAFWPALVLVAATLVFGRFFCGWICPLGTLLDGVHALTRPLNRLTHRRVAALAGRWLAPARHARHVLLIWIFVAALFGVQFAGFADPFALLVRGLALAVDPALAAGAGRLFDWAGDGRAAGVLRGAAEAYLLPLGRMRYEWAGVAAATLGVIVGLELLGRRVWCRFLCPLGAGLGLLARASRVQRLPAKVCADCGDCAALCRMDALDAARGFAPENCTLCMDCVARCPRGMVRFRLRGRAPAVAPPDFRRRQFLAAAVTGVVLPAAARVARAAAPPAVDPHALRPPGVDDEERFLRLCIRCGECMKVCPTNLLQPGGAREGLEGLFAPRPVPRHVFEQTSCDYTCTLCGQVCPTGAIPRLDLAAKQARAIGRAWIDRTRCRPWAEGVPCSRCEEVCPVPGNAIRLTTVRRRNEATGAEEDIQFPRVETQRCVGCGACEANCPVDGEAAIRVRRLDAPAPAAAGVGMRRRRRGARER